MAGSDYFRAAYPEPCQILGVRLRPFSLGHYLKLRRLENAFVSDKTEAATLGDLVVGVAVCSMRSHPDAEQDEFWVWLNRTAPEGCLARVAWGCRKLTAALFKRAMPTPAELDMWQWGRRVGVFDLAEKAGLFADYIRTHSACPRFWEERNNEGRKSGATWVHAVLHTLTSKCGYTQVEACNVSVSKALADYFKHAENEGVIRLMTPEEVEFLETAEAST